MGGQVITDPELLIMSTIEKLLSQCHMPMRHRIVVWINSKYESLPVTDKRGRVIEEVAPETDPPILKFISDHRKSDGEAVEAP